MFLGASFIDWKPKASQSSEVIQPEPPILSDDKKREMLEKEKVWISDPHDGFVLGRIIDLTEEGALVERVHGKRCETTVSFEQLYLDFQALSVIKGGVILRDIILKAPAITVVRETPTTYSFTDLLEQFTAPANPPPDPAKPSKPTRYSLNNIQILKATGLAKSTDNPRVQAVARDDARGDILSADGIVLGMATTAV